MLPHKFSLIVVLSQYWSFIVAQDLNFNYFFDPPTYSNGSGNRTEWPCGNYRPLTTVVPLDDFYMLVYNQSPGTDLSFLMTSGNDTSGFDVLLGRTVHMQDVGWMSWFLNLASAGEHGQVKTIQMISRNNTMTTYICVQVQLDANLTSTDETGTQRSNETYIGDNNTTDTTTYTTDGLLANGSMPRLGAITIPFSAEAAIDGTDPSQSMTGQISNLSTGAKIGLGVAIPLVVILLVIFAVVILRRSKAKQFTQSRTKVDKPVSSDEKPELLGSAYDATIAGPVKPKPELAIDEHTRYEADSKFHPSATHPELPHPSFSANAPWSHPHEGYLPAELANNPQESHRLLVGSGGPAEPALASDSAKEVNPAHGIARNPQLFSQEDHKHNDDVLASEADFLVQELGLISMRKKALIGAATSQGIRPEDVPGTRGEDYRELVVRETRLRSRMAEMDRGR